MVGDSTRKTELQVYRTQTQLSTDKVNAIEKGSFADLFYKKLGHISEKGMEALPRKKLLPIKKGMHLNRYVHLLIQQAT